MNATEVVPSAHASRLIPIAAIASSKVNPRVIFDKAALDELTDSVKAKGVLQPIIVRVAPYDGVVGANHAPALYEIVAGERRYRAATAAKLDAIPAIVRELSDADVEEIQLIENLQRADLHPLDEAVAFDKLRRDGKVSVEQIGAQVHKSRAYVAQRLKLCALTETGRKAFKAGKLNLGVAFLLARITDPKRQDEATKQTLGWEYGHNVSQVSSELQRRYMLELAHAVFPITDATLVPAAGSCTDCPKRTGNARDLFGDVKSGDLCTDPPCYETKRAAYRERQVDEAKKAGSEIILGKQAAQIVSYGHVAEKSGFVKLDDKFYGAGPQSGKTFRQIAGKGAKVTLIEDARNEGLVECVALKDSEALRGVFKGARVKSKSSMQQSDAERKRKAEGTVRAALFEAIVEKFDGDLKPPLMRLVFKKLFHAIGSDTAKRLRRLWEPEAKAADDYSWQSKYDRKIDQLTDVDVRKRLLQTAIAGELYVPGYSTLAQSDVLKDVAAHLRLDAHAIRKTILAGVKPKRAVKKQAPSKKPKPAAKKSRKGGA
jgi:ParB/RepB/Spo0J family partition protein